MHEINKHYECLGKHNHNAAVWENSPLESYDASIWEEILQVNLTAPFLLTKSPIPLVKTSKFAHNFHIFWSRNTRKKFLGKL